MPSIDLGRLRGVMSALAAVAVAFALCATVARSLVTTQHALPVEDPTMDFVGYEAIGSAVAGELSRSREMHPTSEPLAIFLGSSTTECAFDPVRVRAGDPQHRRWLNLHGPGPNLSDLRGLVQLIFQTSLAPRSLVLGLNPGMLATSRSLLSDEKTWRLGELFQHVLSRKLGLANRDLSVVLRVPVQRALPMGQRFAAALRLRLFDMRVALFRRLGVGLSFLFVPDRLGWVEPEWASATSTPEFFHQSQIVGWETKGWFDADNYSEISRNAAAFRDLVALAARHQCQVIAVIMPESARLRSRLPVTAVPRLKGVIESASRLGPLVMVDWHAALEDEFFLDLIHENPAGRRETTRRFLELLAHE